MRKKARYFATGIRKLKYNKNKLVQVLILEKWDLTARTGFWIAFIFSWGVVRVF